MIFIDRESTDENGVPIRPNGDWFKAAAAATRTAIVEREKHEFDEALYKRNSLRAALERLFHDKCAYCEWKATGGSDWDVEHFRPKGRVAERKDHPGYYWLAYEWSNLYLSCTHCNQKRKDRPRWDDPVGLPVAGKLDHFPLSDETTRIMTHENNDDLLLEKKLLIDPCYDHPEEYIGFDLTGEALSLNDNPYGEPTINVFNLKRRRLKKLRQEKVMLTVETLKLVRKLEREGGNAAINDFRVFLHGLQADTAEFAAVARHVIRDPDAFGVT